MRPKIIHKCLVPKCGKDAVREVHFNFQFDNRGNMKGFTMLLLCKEHFKRQEKYFKLKNEMREIFNLKPNPDAKEVVTFT